MDAMTLTQLIWFWFFAQQNQMMVNMVSMMQHDRPQAKQKGHLANAKLNERNYRSITKFNNRRDGWREWKLHFMSAVRECDTSFADLVWGHEKLAREVDILDFDPT